MAVLEVLTLGDKGNKVKVLQRAINRRGKVAKIAVDGDLGRTTWSAWLDSCVALGGNPKRLTGNDTRAKTRYRLVRFPGLRTPVELARATAYRKNKGTGPKAAIAFAARYIGKTEQPAGSNTATWGLGSWTKQLLGLNYGVYWCGIFMWACLRAAGVKGLTSRMASVEAVYYDAKAGKNGLRKLVGKTEGQTGDLVGLFSISTHIEIIEKRGNGGYYTIGGNTSSGNAGSQNNGGGVYRRFRSYSSVAYVARPNYS